MARTKKTKKILFLPFNISRHVDIGKAATDRSYLTYKPLMIPANLLQMHAKSVVVVQFGRPGRRCAYIDERRYLAWWDAQHAALFANNTSASKLDMLRAACNGRRIWMRSVAARKRPVTVSEKDLQKNGGTLQICVRRLKVVKSNS